MNWSAIILFWIWISVVITGINVKDMAKDLRIIAQHTAQP